MSKRRLRGRELNGILLLDKPIGITSNKALQTVKNLYFAQKAGHTGSLDPLATGMLPICFGETTKFSQFLLDADKQYTVTAQLGERTTTCDSEGEVIETKEASHIGMADIENVLPQFRGDIQQIPSMFSALKHNGQPLYKLARQGIEVERKARDITIFQLTLLSYADQRLHLQVHCSKGTYIRNLVDDIGQALGCGAHVIELRRTQVASFASEQMVSMQTLAALREEEAFTELDDFILPLNSIAQGMPHLQVTSAAAFRLLQGQVVDDAIIETPGLFCLLREQQFIGIGEVDDVGHLRAKRMIKS